ncbi:MAG: glycoside hydrolase family 95-like protein [Cyclobacteriaceae bacterium]
MIWETLPDRWVDAPHFGNGMIGSMLYRSGNNIKLQVFRADVQDHRDDNHGWTAYSRPLLQVGHFMLETVGEPTGAEWCKDLWNAELRGVIHTDRGEIGIIHYVHAEKMVIVTELTPSEGEKDLTWTWHPGQARTTRGGYPDNEEQLKSFADQYGEFYAEEGRLVVPYEPNPDPRTEKKSDITVSVQDLLAGGGHATAWREVASPGGQRIHLASIAKTFPEGHIDREPGDPGARDKAVSEVMEFAAGDRDAMSGSHRAWWQAYYPRSYVSVPDLLMEDLYWQTIYRLGCNSRAGRAFTPTAGIWFQGGNWCYKTINWNIQASHWPVYAANRLEQGEEVVNAVHRYKQNLIENVRPVEWQKNSAFAAHAVAAFDWIGPRDHDMRWWDQVGCLPWVLHNTWWQYRFSMDEDMLREKIFPILRRSINFYLHLLEESGDGTLHLPPTLSPEIFPVTADCNFDLALLRWGCEALLEASERLEIDDPLRSLWQDVLDRLVDFPVDERGFRLGRDSSAPRGYRHMSHLMMIYPLYQVTVEQPEYRELIETSLRTYAEGQEEGLPAMVAGHLAAALASTGDGDGSLEWMKRQLHDLTPAGLWDVGRNSGYQGARVNPGNGGTGPPVLEASVSYANNLQNMLIQSWGGTIRVFPAMPTEEWSDATFHNLRAEGAFLVSAARRDNQTQWVRVKSLAGEPCVVRPDLEGEVKILSERPVELKDLNNGLYELNLDQGDEVLLYTGDQPEAVVRPVH